MVESLDMQNISEFLPFFDIRAFRQSSKMAFSTPFKLRLRARMCDIPKNSQLNQPRKPNEVCAIFYAYYCPTIHAQYIFHMSSNLSRWLIHTLTHSLSAHVMCVCVRLSAFKCRIHGNEPSINEIIVCQQQCMFLKHSILFEISLPICYGIN